MNKSELPILIAVCVLLCSFKGSFSSFNSWTHPLLLLPQSFTNTLPAGWWAVFSLHLLCSCQRPQINATHTKTLVSLLIHLTPSCGFFFLTLWSVYIKYYSPFPFYYHCVFVCLPLLLNWKASQRHPSHFCPHLKVFLWTEKKNEWTCLICK